MFLLASLLGIFTSSFNTQPNSVSSIEIEQKKPKEPFSSDPSWRVPNKGARVNLIGDFLYWSANTSALLQGFKANNSSTPLHTKIKPFEIAYKPGFRVGLGYRLPHDNWEVSAYVTQLRTTNHLHQTAHSDAFIAANFGNSGSETPHFDRQVGNWHLKYTLFDVELFRCFAVSKALTISPFIGTRGAWIHQREHLSFFGSNNLDVDAENHYRAGGLRLGTDLSFYFMRYLCLFGKASTSLIWGQFYEETHVKSDGETLFFRQGQTTKALWRYRPSDRNKRNSTIISKTSVPYFRTQRRYVIVAFLQPVLEFLSNNRCFSDTISRREYVIARDKRECAA